jgi:transportin-3
MTSDISGIWQQTPHYMLLFRMPADYTDMSNNQKRNWKQDRTVCVDVLRDAAAVLGSTRALAILIQPLHELNNAPTFDWRTAELALHCIRSVRSTKGMSSEAQLETLLAMLPSLPRQYQYLQYSAALVLSSYTDVLAQRIATGRCAELLPRWGGAGEGAKVLCFWAL